MTSLSRRCALLLLIGPVAGCSLFQRKGPIAQESSRLQSTGGDLKAEGEKDVSEGMKLQNDAKEMRVLAADKRKQAEAQDAAGNRDGGDQLRLEANSQEAEATAAESKGREQENRGREMVRRGDEALRRSESLERQGEQIYKKGGG